MIKKLIAACLIIVTGCAAPAHVAHDGWVQLFNGKDLSGWLPKIKGYALNDNYGNTFRVANGVLQVNYDHYTTFNDRFGHLFFHKPFSHYLLAVEYRFTGPPCPGIADWAYKNSGVMLHCQPPQSMLKDQDFPISLEAQLLGGDSTGTRTTCNLCTPGTEVVYNGKQLQPHCINSTSGTYRGTAWVRAEMLVLGDSVITHIVNGDTVLRYQKPTIGGGVVSNYDPRVKVDGTALKSGYISLQSEGYPIEFRKVEIKDLSKN